MAGVTAPVPGSTWAPAWIATVSIRISSTSPDLPAPGIVQRLAAHDGRDRFAEELHRQTRARRGRSNRDVAVRDRRADRVAVAPAGHPADRTPFGQDRLAPERDHARIGQGEADELGGEPVSLLPHERLAADEITARRRRSPAARGRSRRPP